jgi:hypothetical protein
VHDRVYDLADQVYDHYFPYGIPLARFWPHYQDVRGRRRDGSKIGVHSVLWGIRQLFWGGRAVGVFTTSLITLDIGSVVSHRGDVVRGKAKSHAVAFADACRNHWTTTPWLLWSDSLAVLVTVSGKRRPKLNRLWSGQDAAYPVIDIQTGELTWPDGSSLQLDLTDEKRKRRLSHQHDDPEHDDPEPEDEDQSAR